MYSCSRRIIPYYHQDNNKRGLLSRCFAHPLTNPVLLSNYWLVIKFCSVTLKKYIYTHVVVVMC